MDTLMHDLRYAVRMLRKAPGLTVVAVLTIALGVGLTTHTFSVVYGAMLRRPSFEQGTPLLHLSRHLLERNVAGGMVPILDVLDWREQQTSFDGLAAFRQGATINLADAGSPPERYRGSYVSANLFEQVGAAATVGRTFTPDEDVGAPVVVLSHALWQNRFAGAPDIIGRDVTLNSSPMRVIGIMPEGFRFPFAEDLWLPLGIDPLVAERGAERVEVVGRLAEGVTVEQANAELQGIAARIADAHPRTNEGVGVWVQSYVDRSMPNGMDTVLWVQLLAVFGVLLVACFNVANLLLARAAVRSREVAVHAALGADRGRLIRQLLLEAGLLAAAGGVGGLAVGWLGIELFNAAILGIQKPYWIEIRLDAAALAFTVAITAFATLAAGTVPAIRATGAQIHELLQDETRGSSSLRMSRLSSALVMGEIALSCALLVGAGMMITSVIKVSTLDLGFEPERIFTARVTLVEADYPDEESRQRFYDRLLDDLRADPGVEAAGLSRTLPAQGAPSVRVAFEGVAYPEPRDRPLSAFTNVTPGFLDALGVRPLEGRDFNDGDRAGAVEVALVNESFAARHFGAESPLERRLQVGGEEGPWVTIVGVVPDIYVGGGGVGGMGSDAAMTQQFLRPLAQSTEMSFVRIAVRTRGPPEAFARDARELVRRIDPGLPVFATMTMAEAVDSATWIFGIVGSLFTMFGIAALFLAGVGLYGVMAFSVGRRTQEMGIRMALGASGHAVFGMVLGQGMRRLAIGGVVGLALGAAMARPLSAIFFEVEPTDPLVYAAIAATMTATGLLACALPARRATRIELVEALRPE